MQFGKLQTRSITLFLLAAASPACGATPSVDLRASQSFSDPALAALATAACRGNAETVFDLTRHGADPNGAGSDGITPLAWAIQCQNVSGVRALLKTGANANHEWHGTNMVWLAAGYSEHGIVKALVDAGGDINNIAPSGHTVLMHALESRSWSTYDYLLKSGVRINACEKGGLRSSVADLAISAGELDRLDDLLDRGYRCDLLGIAYGLEHFNWSPEYIPKRDRLLVKLRSHGVEWPLPDSLTTEARLAYLAKHPEYARRHPESAISVP